MRTKHDTTLLMTLACGATVEQTAQKLGLSTRTIYRRLADPEFRKGVQNLRDDMVQRTAGMLTAAAGEAVKTLLALQNSSISPAVRLGAARAIIELGVKLRETAELTERIANLETLVGVAT